MLGFAFREDLARFWRRVGPKGQLAVNTEQGWQPIDPHLEQHRFWGPEDAFLLPHLTLERVEEGLDLGLIELRREPNPQVVPVVVVRADPQYWRFRLLANPDFSRQTVQDVALDHPSAAVVVNASYFSEEGPVGLLVQDGRERVPQGTAWAAHFLVEAGGQPRIVNEKQTALGEDLLQAFQGFPAIMSGGETFSYMRYGGRGFPVHTLARRTAVCTDLDGMVWILVTDTVTNGLTLSETATVLGGLGCHDAMGFDGGSSTQLHVDAGERRLDVLAADGIPVVMALEPR